MNFVPVAELCEVNPKHPVEAENNDLVAFVGMADLNERTAVAVDSELRPFGEVSKGYKPIQRNDILMAKITPCFQNCKIGQALTSTEIAAGSTEFHVLRPGDRLEARYLLHFLRQPWVLHQGELRMTGSGGQRRVPERFLSDLRIPLPPVEEQRRIAEVLDTADGLRTKRRQAIAKLDTLTQSIFIDTFGDPVTNPYRWQKDSLGHLLSHIDSGKSPVCEPQAPQGGQWGVLKAGAVTYCEYDPTAAKTLPSEIEPHKQSEVRPGDVLFARKNTHALVAACAFVRSTPQRLLLSDLIFRLVIKDQTKLRPLYLQQTIVSPRQRQAVQALAGGAAGSMPNISKAKLLEVEIPVAPPELQLHFEALASEVHKQQLTTNRALLQADMLFESLQQRAFAGEL